MAVTVEQVQTAVGRSLTQVERDQVTMWTADALIIIADRLGDVAELDQQKLDMVVRDVVARRVKLPDDVSQQSTTIDGDTTQRTYVTSTGRIEVTDAEWDLLTPNEPVSSGAGNVRLAYSPGWSDDR